MFKRNIKISSFIFIFISIIYCSTNSSSSTLLFPLQTNYILTSQYGYRDFDNSFHDGIDCAVSVNTPLYSMYNGTVTFSGFDISGGNMIIIQYDNGYKSMYCHMSSKLEYKTGNRVSKGSVVGYVGPKYLENGKLNGYTTGVHLHFSLYKDGKSIDPLSLKYE